MGAKFEESKQEAANSGYGRTDVEQDSTHVHCPGALVEDLPELLGVEAYFWQSAFPADGFDARALAQLLWHESPANAVAAKTRPPRAKDLMSISARC